MEEFEKPKYKGKLTTEYQEDLFRYLLSNLKLKLDDNEVLLLRKAYNTAFEAHRDQIRKVSKEPYIIHPVEVALIVANEMGLDFIAVLAALLHDVLEDSELYTYEYIKKEFGEAVALTVEGVTKMTRVGGKTRPSANDKKINEKLETFKKLILSISKEYRVILIKIADRLHNMRTMAGMPEEKQKAKSAENLYVYAKFAEAIGMYDIKNEMEDLSFQYLFPDEYKKIKAEVEKIQPYRDKFLNDLSTELFRILSNDTKYKFRIKRIRNSYYNLWEKLNNNPNLNVSQVHNFEALRIIIDPGEKEMGEASYHILYILTKYFNVLQNSIRDFYSHPKANGFRALMFDIAYPHHAARNHIPLFAEIQIMSEKDDVIAHKGANFERLKESISPIAEDESILDFIQRVINQLNTDFIYVFTPEGEIHNLPKGATVIDFGFKIHTDMGLHCTGANIRGVGAKPPTYRLKSGDIVEVIHTEKKEPEYEWLKVVVTSKAKRELMKYFKHHKLKSDPKDRTKIESKFVKNLPLVIDSNIDFKIADCCNPIPGDKAVAIQDENGNIIIHRADCKDLPFYAEISPSGVTSVEWAIKEISYSISISAMDRIGLLKDILDIISESLKLNIVKINMDIDPNEKLVQGNFIVKIHQNDRLTEKKNSICKAENSEDEKDCANKALNTLIKNLQNIKGMVSVEVRVYHQ